MAYGTNTAARTDELEPEGWDLARELERLGPAPSMDEYAPAMGDPIDFRRKMLVRRRFKSRRRDPRRREGGRRWDEEGE